VTSYRIPVAGGDDAVVSASPAYLHELIRALDPGDVTVTIPRDLNDTVRVQQGSVTALLMPIDPARGVVGHVEEVTTVVFGEDVVHTDGDGDYPLSAAGIPVYARIMPGDPIRLAVFAQVLVDVELNEDLLVELNQLNVSTGMVKVLWNDHTVIVSGE